MKQPRVAIIRGKFLNRYEMQCYERLTGSFRLTAFASRHPLDSRLAFPVVSLPSPADFPDVPYKMPVLNRVFTDAHLLWGLEDRLRGYDIAHAAETYYRYTQQALDAKKHGNVQAVVSTVWETIPFANEGIRGRKEYKERAHREVDRFIAVSARARDALVSEGVPASRISVVHACVDTARFTPGAKARTASDGLTVLFVGRLEPEKGISELAAAIETLARDPELGAKNITWKFVGRGSLRSEVIAIASRIPKNWHSSMESATYEEMPDIYRRADLLVAPSQTTATWEEQWGMVLTEAQASGLPIVAADSGAIRENVGPVGVLVPPRDTTALAASIREMLLSPAKLHALSTRAVKRARQMFDVRVGASGIAAVYDRVLQKVRR